MFSTHLRDQSHGLIHILFVLCRRFRLMSLKFYFLVIHISHKTLEIGCAWSKGSGERLHGHHGPLVLINLFPNKPWFLSVCGTSLLKTPSEKEKLLLTSNFFFSHSVFYPFGELFIIFIEFEMVICKLLLFGRV